MDGPRPVSQGRQINSTKAQQGDIDGGDRAPAGCAMDMAMGTGRGRGDGGVPERRPGNQRLGGQPVRCFDVAAAFRSGLGKHETKVRSHGCTQARDSLPWRQERQRRGLGQPGATPRVGSPTIRPSPEGAPETLMRVRMPGLGRPFRAYGLGVAGTRGVAPGWDEAAPLGRPFAGHRTSDAMPASKPHDRAMSRFHPSLTLRRRP